MITSDNNNLAPTLRFTKDDGSAYPDWQVKRLGEVAEVVKTKNIENNQNILTISAQYGLINQEIFFNKRIASKNVSNYYLIEKNDFAYNKSYSKGYPMGAIKKLNNYDKGVVSTLYICFRFIKNINTQYCHYYFDSGNQNIEIAKVAQEGARNHGLLNISLNDFFKTPIPLPSLEEQEKIAKFLASIDAKINLISLQLDTFYHYKKALLQQLFPHHTSLNPNLRFLKDNGSDYPDWQVKKLGEVFILTRGQVLAKDKLGVKDTIYKYPVYSSQTKNKGLLGYYNMFLFQDCITWTTDGANAGNVNFRQGKFYCTNVCGVMKNDNGYANQCIAEMINSIAQQYVSYVGNPKLMNNVMSEIELPLPCLEEQLKIANLLSALDNKIYLNLQKLKAYQLYKKALLQQLFPYIP